MTNEHRGDYDRGFLPHRDHPGTLQFVTFVLADALPASARSDDFERLDTELERGRGECLLARPEAAEVVAGALRHFDGERYDLGPWVVMPNHVHVVVRLREEPLGRILHSWKSFSAHRINAALGRTGPVWLREYFDRMIRSRSALLSIAAYVHENPVKAGLVARAEAWRFSSARDGDAVGRLWRAS